MRQAACDMRDVQGKSRGKFTPQATRTKGNSNQIMFTPKLQTEKICLSVMIGSTSPMAIHSLVKTRKHTDINFRVTDSVARVNSPNFGQLRTKTYITMTIGLTIVNINWLSLNHVVSFGQSKHV